MKTILYTNDIFEFTDEQKNAARLECAECYGLDPENVRESDVEQWLLDEYEFEPVVQAIERESEYGFILQAGNATRYPELYGSGARTGYKFVEHIESAVRNSGDYVTIYTDEQGRLFYDYSHHDGSGTVEIKAVTARGFRLYDFWNYNYDDKRTEFDVLQTMFTTNFFSRRLRNITPEYV